MQLTEDPYSEKPNVYCNFAEYDIIGIMYVLLPFKMK